MGKINTLKLDSHPRGDSGVLRWSWVKKESDGTTRALSLVGYKAALTVKSPVYDDSVDDSTAASGYNNVLWKIDVDCDNPTQMHGIDPANGMILFAMPKQANWVEPGTYNIDIVFPHLPLNVLYCQKFQFQTIKIFCLLLSLLSCFVHQQKSFY